MTRIKAAALRLAMTALVLALGAAPAFAQDVPHVDEREDPGLFEKLRLSGEEWFLVPVLLYSPETGFGGGATWMYVMRDREEDPRPSSIQVLGIYTAENQFNAALRPRLYLMDDALLLDARASFSNFSLKYWGVGNRAPDILEEDYQSSRAKFSLAASYRVWKELRVGAGYEFFRSHLEEFLPGGLIATGLAPGAPDAIVSGLGPSVTWDSRDHPFASESGGYYHYESIFYEGAFGSDADYVAHRFDLRRFFTPAKNHTIGVQLLAQFIDGDPPFESFSQLGGRKMLRGIFSGRYRDRHMIAGQLEYRFPIWWFIGGAAFGAAGQVTHEVDRFEWDHIRWAAGGGLRFKVDRKNRINLRLDFAGSDGEFAVYFDVGEAF
ncbi:MAG: BamA/TamA family outer membrane protein [Chrysiogenetes bacterium]|nr:BamA/TamA family outer membrane protein [Chrysiogenetes bacterium]